jgi:hypothetical protein
MRSVVEAVIALHEEPIFEDGDKAKGISVRFLARMTLLRVAAGLLHWNDSLAAEAYRIIDGDGPPCPTCGNEERGQGGYLSCQCPA